MHSTLENGLIPYDFYNDWLAIEFANNLMVSNSYFADFYNAMILFADALGDEAGLTLYTARRQALVDKINEVFYGWCLDNPLGTGYYGTCDTLAAAPLAMALEYGIVPEELQNKVEEMYISLKSKTEQDIPILLNAFRNERDGKMFNDCVCVPMKRRYEYEQALLAVKRETDTRNKMKKKQIAELDLLRHELESKQNELLELNKKLQKLAVTDELTDLKNRRSLQENLSLNVTLHSERFQTLSLLLIDIDYFKNINDNFGHMMGDNVLRELGKILKDESRKDDIAARYGGEEYA